MVLIIDGDVLAYKSCESRQKPKDPFGMILTELDEHGEAVPPEYTEFEEEQYKQKIWRNFKKFIETYSDMFFSDEVLVAVKSDTNYRDDLYPDYKAHRKNSAYGRDLAPYVKYIRKRAVANGIAIEAHGKEADDYLRIWANECTTVGKEFIIISVDKDLLCIPGKHYVLDKSGNKGTIVDMSELDAMRHYYSQLLKGDPTDNIPGVPKVGDVIAKRLTDACKTEEELQEVTVAEYVRAYGDDWYQYLLSNGKMIHIMGHESDYFQCSHWSICKELL